MKSTVFQIILIFWLFPFLTQNNSLQFLLNGEEEVAGSSPYTKGETTPQVPPISWMFAMPISTAAPSVVNVPFEGFDHLAGIADDLASGELFSVATGMAQALQSRTFNIEKVVDRLTKFFRRVTDADVAFARGLELENGMTAKLLLPLDQLDWRPGFSPVGTPPLEKHFEDGPCFHGNLETDGGDRPEKCNNTARARRKGDGQAFYTEEEIKFLEWVRSEAWIVIRVNEKPKALICVGQGHPGHFFASKIAELRRYEAFVNAFFRLAELADERLRKVDAVQKISSILPILSKSPSLRGFQRALLTLLTCEFGRFKFDRAFLFWMENQSLPAKCDMAVGGLDSPTWKTQRDKIRDNFGSLAEYIQDSIRFPTPGTGKGNVPDPLYDKVVANPLYFREGDGGTIRELIKGNVVDVPKLTDQDPWVKRIQEEHPGILTSPHNEYFVLPLTAPLSGGSGPPPLLGFIVAHSFSPHDPNQDDAPDLVMASHVLSVAASVWAVREEAENHFNVVSSLPILRHHAPAVEQFLNKLEFLCRDPHVDIASIGELVQQAIPCAVELTEVIDVLVDTRTKRISQYTVNPERFLNDVLAELSRAHGGKLITSPVVSRMLNPELQIPPRVLHSIVSVLCNNAVSSATDASLDSVHLNATMEPLDLPQAPGREKKFVRITIGNDGPPILPKIEKYLFVDGMSTHKSGTIPHRGTGLASARLQAQAYGGELVLLSPDPVQFGIVLVTK
jgi:hypothetical protein